MIFSYDLFARMNFQNSIGFGRRLKVDALKIKRRAME
jgi:hypothetical protein